MSKLLELAGKLEFRASHIVPKQPEAGELYEAAAALREAEKVLMECDQLLEHEGYVAPLQRIRKLIGEA